MDYVEAEVARKFPAEECEEASEIPHPQSEFRYTSKELAKEFGVTDRTVRNWITDIRNEIFYWCPNRLVVGDKYSQFCFDELQEYNHQVRLGKKDFAQYKQEKLVEHNQMTNHSVIDHRAIANSKTTKAFVEKSYRQLMKTAGLFNKVK